MKELTLELDFSTPAFLGNADQLAQWRTPPIKALIRQWWRVAQAKACNYDHTRLLKEENALFGKAADKTATRSMLRLRLGSWSEGSQKTWSEIGQVEHREVQRRVGASLYLGYGPLTYSKETRTSDFGESKSSRKKRTAIEPGSQKTSLWIGFPNQYEQVLFQVLQLIDWFGTLGSRSRNGWGSLALGLQGAPALTRKAVEPFTRDWKECLEREWAHAIGKDAKGPLVWQTAPEQSWKGAMKKLAEIKIAFRTSQGFSSKGPHPQPCPRHVLAYPVTNHGLNGLDNNARLTNQLRFKVAKHGATYRGIIVHLPCRAPDETVKKLKHNDSIFRNLEKTVWPEVHAVLDRLLPDGRLK